MQRGWEANLVVQARTKNLWLADIDGGLGTEAITEASDKFVTRFVNKI